MQRKLNQLASESGSVCRRRYTPHPNLPKSVRGAARAQHRISKIRGDTRSHRAVRNPTPRAIVGMSEYLVDSQRLVESGVNFLERFTQKRSEVHDPFGRIGSSKALFASVNRHYVK